MKGQEFVVEKVAIVCRVQNRQNTSISKALHLSSAEVRLMRVALLPLAFEYSLEGGTERRLMKAHFRAIVTGMSRYIARNTLD